jgi:hypothetical protein
MVIKVSMGGAAPPPAGNQAPVVDASASGLVGKGEPIPLTGTVTDDNLPDPPGRVTLRWTQESGPGQVTFAKPAAARTTATFSAAGVYIIRLTADDGDLTGYDEVRIQVIENLPDKLFVPFVNGE